MIVGHHVIFGAYGFWLPNDPRGSWSDFVGSWELFRHGLATKTTQRRSLAGEAHDRGARLVAKQSLKHRPVRFSGLQARAVARGFARFVERRATAVWACAIMPDHVHLVLAQKEMKVEQAVIQMKSAATRQLLRERCHPFLDSVDAGGKRPKCFARGEWKVFLDPPDVSRAIRYVEENPVKEGFKRQRWKFVTPPSAFW